MNTGLKKDHTNETPITNEEKTEHAAKTRIWTAIHTLTGKGYSVRWHHDSHLVEIFRGQEYINTHYVNPFKRPCLIQELETDAEQLVQLNKPEVQNDATRSPATSL